ncbi:hypothetical protein M3Y98_00696500 [Aphelenchoides besseyi]|nr:hypothetical protein M3Y98_00696500 [Aphelenchoides besseyi]KAI6208937.1 hypothetical protein M3Y96_00167800 [Aphelenchoides besseyi]
MFLIAKIVRGRRLLHELEQAEKEKERERERQERQRAAADSLSIGSLNLRRGTTKKKSVHAIEGTSAEAEDAGVRRRKTWNMERTMRMGAELVRRGSRQFTTIYDRRVRIQRNSFEKALRQKTDISLGLTDKMEQQQRLRRTSSMPSVVERAEKIRHYNYDIKLNKLQKRALRFTWHRLHTRNGGKRVENVFEEIYERLMRTLPTMREMFTTRTFLSAMTKNEHFHGMRDHARFTVKMFDVVIKNLDQEDNKRSDTLSEYDPILIGKAHTCLRPYGFVSSMWEKLGETIIDVVLVQEAVRDLPGAGQAWVVLTACLVDQLRAGFESSQRGYSVKPSACPMNQPSEAAETPLNCPYIDDSSPDEQHKQHRSTEGLTVVQNESRPQGRNSLPSETMVRSMQTSTTHSSPSRNSPDQSLLHAQRQLPILGNSTEDRRLSYIEGSIL